MSGEAKHYCMNVFHSFVSEIKHTFSSHPELNNMTDYQSSLLINLILGKVGGTMQNHYFSWFCVESFMHKNCTHIVKKNDMSDSSYSYASSLVDESNLTNSTHWLIISHYHLLKKCLVVSFVLNLLVYIQGSTMFMLSHSHLIKRGRIFGDILIQLYLSWYMTCHRQI